MYGSQGLISTMVDVYSYGILLMEILSRRKPTDEMFSGEITMRRWVSESFPDSILQIVDNELVNTYDRQVRAIHERCLTLAIGLALECTADLPEERPDMRDVLTTIREIKTELQMKLYFVKKESLPVVDSNEEMAVSLCLHNCFHDLMERHMLQSWRDKYDRFLRSSEERNVGIGYGVTAQYFLDIENVNVDFEENHINAYLDILHRFLKNPTARVAIVDTMFSVNVQEIWMVHHGDDDPDTIYDSETVEDLSGDELQFLLQYVTGGERPFGANSSGWFECDEVIVVCNFSGHWVVCKLNLTSCTITVFDSMQHRFTSSTREQRVVDTRPLARIVPALLMHAGFWDRRVDLRHGRFSRRTLQPRLTQWPIEMPRLTNTFLQTDSHSCGPFAMMYVEAILTGVMSPDGAQDRISAYRQHVAQTIFRFSADS